VKAFNRHFLLVKIFLHNLVLRPTVTASFSILFLHTQAATMRRFSYNTTGLSPVLKKPHPTMKGQEKKKAGAKQDQPWIVQGAKKTKNNNKQKLKTTTDDQDLFLRSLLRGTPSLALPKRDKMRASSQPIIDSRKLRRHHRYGLCRRESTPYDIDHR
jgi:hypothetical protein